MLLFISGLLIIILFAEKLVRAIVQTSLSLGLSTFIISVIFIGFDPENLVVGSVASSQKAAGIALGSIIGSAMVAITLALGLTALISPLKFQRISRKILAIPIVSILLFGLLSLDGLLSRLDGVLLLAAFLLAVLYLVRLSQQGISIESSGELAESLEVKGVSKLKSMGLLFISLLLIIVGSELIIISAKVLIARLCVSETFFSMVILAFLISIEELARELPAALKGRPEITFGNVIGSVLAFFLFNASIIALIRPVSVSSQVLSTYYLFSLASIIAITAFMVRKKIGRLAGLILILFYVGFIVAGGLDLSLI